MCHQKIDRNFDKRSNSKYKRIIFIRLDFAFSGYQEISNLSKQDYKRQLFLLGLTRYQRYYYAILATNLIKKTSNSVLSGIYYSGKDQKAV